MPGLKISDVFPLTIKSAHHIISLHNNDFQRFVVCPGCSSVYEFNDCIEKSLTGHQMLSKSCGHVCYLYHPHASRRTPCGTLLLKKVKSKTGVRLLPVKIYPYKQLKQSIEWLVVREGF